MLGDEEPEDPEEYEEDEEMDIGDECTDGAIAAPKVAETKKMEV